VDDDDAVAFRDIFEHSLDAIGVSARGVHVRANPAYAALFGYAGDADLLGRPILDLIAPDQHALVRERYVRRILGEQPVDVYETRGRRADGSEFDIELRASTHSRGGEVYTTVVVRDVTDRKLAGAERARAVEALRQSEERASRVLETVVDGILMIDLDGRYTFANPAAERLLGVTRDHLCGRFVRDGLWRITTADGQPCPPDQMPMIRVLSTGEPVTGVDLNLDRGDGGGAPVILSVNAAPLRDGDGAVVGAVASLRDMTRRRQAEMQRARALQALRESEWRFRDMADSAPVLLWMADADARCYYFNQPWLLFTGRTLEQETGDGWLEGVHPDDRARAELSREEAFAAGEPFRTEYRLRGADGEYRWLLESGTPRVLEGGTFAGFIGSAIDITERKRAEVEREQALRENARLLETVREAASRQRAFVREVMASVTEGRLILCDTKADLPAPLPPAGEPMTLTHDNLGQLRRRVRALAEERALPAERWQDLVTAVGEAAMNAVVHAGGGSAQVGVGDDGDTLQVWIRDRGKGISVDHLHLATLQRGYTTAGTMGHGFWIILKTVDRVWLLTGPTGTTVVLQQSREEPTPSWLADAAP
jgi:PAS domain S-box-containing protein